MSHSVQATVRSGNGGDATCCRCISHVFNHRHIEIQSIQNYSTFQSIHVACTTFILVVIGAVFPNRTMYPNWYGGNINGRKVSSLKIRAAQLSVIKSNAFGAQEFSRLQHLTFVNIPAGIRCQGGWLATHKPLYYLEFHNAPIIDPTYDFLHYTDTNSIVLKSSFDAHSEIANLFAAFEGHLGVLHIRHGVVLRRLGAMQLGRLHLLHTLVMVNCSIEVIAANAFVATKKLETLDLSDNRLTTLPGNLFTELLLQRTFVELRLYNNKWQCRCELLIVKHQLTECGIKFDGFPDDCGVMRVDIDDNEPFKCIPTTVTTVNQHVVKYKSCIMDIGLLIIHLNYPRFKLKSPANDFGRIIINVSLTDNGKPWFYAIAGHHFPTTGRCEVTRKIRCLKFTKHIDVLPPQYIDTERLQRWCFLDGELMSWPSNCITMCDECYMDGFDVWLRIPSLMHASVWACVAALLAMTMGIVVAVMVLRHRPSLLHGADRVIFLKNSSSHRRSSFTIFVMPHGWQQDSVKYNR